MKIIKSEQNYIVDCDEAEWYNLSPEKRDEMLASFRTDAKGRNCTNITVFANPDPVLPIFGIDRRTRVHSEKLASDKPYEMSLTYSAELAPDAWDAMDRSERSKVLREIVDNFAKRGHKAPGRYEIFVTRQGALPGELPIREFIQRGRV